MNKTTKMFAILGIAGVIVIASVAILYLPLQKKPSIDSDENGDITETGRPSTQSSGQINIYVNTTIATSLTSDLAQYELDIEAMGFTADTYGVPNGWDENTLKTHINTTYHGSTGLVGAVLIGELPYALARCYLGDPYFQYYDFPCDLFLTDLDGNWTVINGDNVWDICPNAPIPIMEHNQVTGDWTPEIWLARICPDSIGAPGFNYLQAYKDYFERNRKYRNGTLSKQHRAMLYIDDDWTTGTQVPEWTSNFTAYSGAKDVYSTDPSTTSLYYMGNLSDINDPNYIEYEFVHLWAHSWPQQHLFGPGGNGNDGVLSYGDIYTNDTQPLFYNLYSCYSCNFTTTDNTGTYYLFTSNNTLTVIGSARSGGMDLYQPFYDALNQGKIIGESYRLWWHNPEIIQLNKEILYYGMTILGDPVLKIKEPSAGSGALPAGDDDDDDGKAEAIPLGNFYLVIMVIAIISLIVTTKRKAIFTKNK